MRTNWCLLSKEQQALLALCSALLSLMVTRKEDDEFLPWQRPDSRLSAPAWHTYNNDSLLGHNYTFCRVSLHVTEHRRGKSALLTAKSGLSLSRWLTARMTPDLQSQRAMSPISGCLSPLTQRNRFPTSSGRASTAMALAGRTRFLPPSPEKLPNNDAPTDLSFTTLKWP